MKCIFSDIFVRFWKARFIHFCLRRDEVKRLFRTHSNAFSTTLLLGSVLVFFGIALGKKKLTLSIGFGRGKTT